MQKQFFCLNSVPGLLFHHFRPQNGFHLNQYFHQNCPRIQGLGLFVIHGKYLRSNEDCQFKYLVKVYWLKKGSGTFLIANFKVVENEYPAHVSL